jgi:glycosyltransferase involved in cell wall biosynthesis
MNAPVRSDVASPPVGGSGSRAPHVLIATDAWQPQVNGVVRTLEMLEGELRSLGVRVSFITPEPFPTFGMPSYPEIRLALATRSAISQAVQAAQPDAIHIATEGPIGLIVRQHCVAHQLPFTTCYHTRYPEYVAARLPIPLAWSYAVLRRFHAAAVRTMVATPTLRNELAGHGFANLSLWQRGIDLSPLLSAAREDLGFEPPVHLFVGRIAVEKNIDAFLSLDLPGSKVVVGDGPARAALERQFPEAHFLGSRSGADLARLYASADVFVFPSRTDTFGLVMLEALATGTPVAAFPVAGPREVIGASGCGALDEDLAVAAAVARSIDRDACRRYASQFGMRQSALSFLRNLAWITGA